MKCPDPASRRPRHAPSDPVQDSCAVVLGALAVVLAANGCAPAAMDPVELAEQSSLYALVTTVAGAYFYPPLGPEPPPSRPFDPTLLTRLRVALEADGRGAAGRTLATFDATTRPGLVLLAEQEMYSVNVPAATYFTDPSLTYRFRVLLDEREIGRSEMSSRIFEMMSYVPSLPVGVKLRLEARPAPTSLASSAGSPQNT